ncbi:hypothetical protein K437DRAFT_253437 [Tilletiaria anomala UBC 951]|uniref:FAS1 domain-containing protein n=1 Tax=Tilletiaria anomala (strain ATCC 24038 / CBS 436.72 / UBC 951) TaxID=1037660 RepID=A0A066WQ31_TILAU|nr:uncharacterized protein K437DRAFT_253437 [Tilletiaria anomala UBC 951]KDN53114.1 hypothetical protein K437DRAFT_253437 [Tilletiaria anomala UBC 951]
MQLKLSHLLLVAAAATNIAAVPAAQSPPQIEFPAGGSSSFSAPIGVFGHFIWPGGKVVNAISSLLSSAHATAGAGVVEEVKQAAATSATSSCHVHFTQDQGALLFEQDDTGDKTLWDIINDRKDLSMLAHVLNYSSDSTKDLLANGSSLTLFAPVNRPHRDHDHDHHDHHHHPHHGHHGRFSSMETLMPEQDVWSMLQTHIASYEAVTTAREGNSVSKEDDNDKERRRKILAKIIDAVISYHLVDSETTLTGKQLADNSSVATQLSTEWRNLNDGQPWRVKISQHLLPFPSIRVNHYSTIIRPDVKAKNGLLHAITLPLFPPPSILQLLYFSTPDLSASTLGLVKAGGDGYLALPKPKPDENTPDELDGAYEDAFLSFLRNAHSEREHPHSYPGPGTAAATFIAPSNLAWRRLPPTLRLFLLSPWGERWLAKIFMLHALPHDIVFADSIHHVKASGDSDGKDGSVKVWEEVNVELPHCLQRRPHRVAHHFISGSSAVPNDLANKLGFPGMPRIPNIPKIPAPRFPGRHDEHKHDPHDGQPEPEPEHHGRANVTHYTFLSALPKIHWHNHTCHGPHSEQQVVFAPPHDDDSQEGAKKFETVDVDVYRYHMLPGNFDPVQTRVVVQGEPVWFQDVPASNGVVHVTHRFIMPKHIKKHKGAHRHEHEEQRPAPTGSIDAFWESIVSEAQEAGFALDDTDIESLGL